MCDNFIASLVLCKTQWLCDLEINTRNLTPRLTISTPCLVGSYWNNLVGQYMHIIAAASTHEHRTGIFERFMIYFVIFPTAHIDCKST